MKKTTITLYFCVLFQILPFLAQAQEVGSEVKLSKVFYGADNLVREAHFNINGRILRVHTDGGDTDVSAINATYTNKLDLLKFDFTNLTTYNLDGSVVKSTMYFRLFKVEGEKDFAYIFIEKNGNNNAIANITFSQKEPIENFGNGGKLNFEFKDTETRIVEYLEGISKRWWSLVKSNNQWIGGGDGDFVNYDIEAAQK